MKIYTVIPARGGSKSIPKKNICLLNNKPLLQHSVEYSLHCPQIAHTIVSTDSEEIAEVARKCGAEVPFIRPAEFAQDLTQDYPVMRHALEELEKFYNERIDVIALLRPTSPFRPPNLIERAVALLEKYPNASSVRAVAVAQEHPFRQWETDGPYIVGYEKKVFEPYNIPRQLLPQAYFQTGDLEMVKRQTLMEGSVSGSRVLPLIISHEEMVDIDNAEDWKKAEQHSQK